MSEPYYHGLLRKYVVLFGSLFNNIMIDRVDTSGNTGQELKVPLSYGPKQWYLARLTENPDLVKPIDRTLPRIAFEIKRFRYANERKTNTMNVAVGQNQYTGTKTRLANPVPWDIGIQMSIMVKNSDDAMRIIEQIVPRFTPEYTEKLILVPEMNIEGNVPIILEDIQIDDQYEGSLSDQDRVIIWDLFFTMKTEFYGPVGRAAVIKDIQITYENWSTDGQNVAGDLAVSITPGLTANGTPTTNGQLSIPWQQISANSDWAFVVQYFGFSTGVTPKIGSMLDSTTANNSGLFA